MALILILSRRLMANLLHSYCRVWSVYCFFVSPTIDSFTNPESIAKLKTTQRDLSKTFILSSIPFVFIFIPLSSTGVLDIISYDCHVYSHLNLIIHKEILIQSNALYTYRLRSKLPKGAHPYFSKSKNQYFLDFIFSK